MTEISIALLREVFRYDPSTGVVSRDGVPVGGPDKEGYLRFRAQGKFVYAHRVAWAMMMGRWPKGQIDHRNGITSDNRWDNLRDASQTINQQNQREARSDNQCGYLGVSIVKNGGSKPFRVDIRHGGRQHYLGRYARADEAHQVYLAAKSKHHPGSTITDFSPDR